ncbi:ChbG/HpnK family deacetylase [Paenibacillus hamazuiensis]|uniref:ChbG/HpnK family deacetylase n=1 Tax=Paenibacillus hamazuiensis TaxID=2936508 RepID=UPI0020104B1C|nr:ChbG/HpnK family deacetylase [Paenibacillus hamazuiensis]
MLEKWRLQADDRAVIINADDFGASGGVNRAVERLLRQGSVTSASIMMPCPAAGEAAAFCRSYGAAGVGVHLTLTSSPQVGYKPVTGISRCGRSSARTAFSRSMPPMSNGMPIPRRCGSS